MIKITDLIKEILAGDDVAREALKLNYLNLSAYAKRIQPRISERLYKPVGLGSVIVALSRLRNTFLSEPDYRPEVHIETMAIRPNLAELTFEKTDETLASAAALNPAVTGTDAFFCLTQGSQELTIIFEAKYTSEVLTQFMRKPKGQYVNLTAITVKFIEADYIEVPNMIYTLVSALAVKRINLIEIVSTFTELSFIVRSKDAEQTIMSLSPFLTSG